MYGEGCIQELTAVALTEPNVVSREQSDGEGIRTNGTLIENRNDNVANVGMHSIINYSTVYFT